MLNGSEASSSSEWRSSWRVLPPCVAGIMMSTAHLYSLGVMIAPLEREFGWTRAQISSGPFIISMIALLVAPLVGFAIDRIGARRIGLLGVLFFCAMLSMLSTATNSITTWWTLWACLGLAATCVFPTVWVSVINGLFEKNRGMALAIALCGTSLGATVFPALTNYLMLSYGWRHAYIALAVISLAIALPLVWFLFFGAADGKHAAYTQRVPASHTGFSVRQGLQSLRFLKLTSGVVLFSFASASLTTNSVPILMSRGFTATMAASVVGLIGIGSIAGRLLGGYLLDRMNANKVAAVSVLAPVVTVTILMMYPGSLTSAAIACVILGLSIGTELDASAYLASRHFGMRNFGTLFGTINGMVLFVVGLAPLASNYVYDRSGAYQIVLWLIIPACLVSAALFLSLGPYPTFTANDEAVERKDVEPSPLLVASSD
jgi:MFS family permease